jgi:hypothetical protein
MRYDLTISASYVDDWGIWEGVREIFQNAKDEEDKNSNKMSVTYSGSKKILKIKNDGAFLERKVLLTGFSNKRNDKNMRGMYGEGLKLGSIALLRNDIKIKIRNKNELWAPEFKKSRKFGNEQILSFNVSTKKTDCGGVVVEIIGLEEEDWNDIKEKILFLEKSDDHIDTSHGQILRDKKYQGKIFVKDIFVEYQSGYRYGYNVVNVKVDRDRKMVSTFDRDWELAKCWEFASYDNHEISEEVFDMLFMESNDVVGFKHAYTSSSFKDKMCDIFVDNNGRGAFPVESQDEADNISHIGMRGVIVPSTLRSILNQKFDLSKKESQGKRIRREYKEEELSELARKNLSWVRSLILKIDKKLFDFIDPWIKVVDFYDNRILGRFSLVDKSIFVSGNAVTDKKKLLNVMVEEMAHMTLRNHGHFDFKLAIHEIYSLIIIESGL